MSKQLQSVDCGDSTRGLFAGIFLLVGTVISLIIFFVLMASANVDLKDVAVRIATATELLLYSIASGAVAACMYQVSDRIGAYSEN